MDNGLCMNHLIVLLNYIFLHNSQWITFPTQLCLVLYSHYASLLHSLIMRLMVSSLSPHNLHLPFHFAFIYLVFMTLFWAAIKSAVSLLKFPFRCQLQVFSCEISLVCLFKYPYSFSSKFCFLIMVILFLFRLSVLFLAAVISLSLFFEVWVTEVSSGLWDFSENSC